MALQMFEGFENQHLPAGVSISGGGVNSYPTGRTGAGNAVRYFTSTNQTLFVSYPVTGTTSAVYGGFGFFGTVNSLTWAGIQFFRIREGSTLHLALRWHSDGSGRIELLNGAGTVLATTTGTWAMTGVWNHFAFEAVINDTTGSFKLFMNGSTSPVINITGTDTRNAGAGTVTNVALVGPFSGLTNAATFDMDDVYIGDTTGSAPYNASLGDCVVETLRPNGNGATNAWLGSDGNSTDNYLLVDDFNTTSDYVGSATSTQRDLYTMTDLTSVIATPLAVQMEVYAAKDASGGITDLNEVYRSSGGTVVTGEIADAAVISTTYQFFRGAIRTTDPDAAAWTTSSVNAMQTGFENA